MTIQQSDTQGDPVVTGDVISTQIGDQASVVAVGKNITQVVYQQVTPPRLDAATVAAANAKLAQLPLDTIPPIAPLPTGSRIPYSVNPLFVGREAELLTLAAQLKGGQTMAIGQIAAATGLGGIGKTQLAVAFAHHYGQFFAGGVQWLSFADPGAIPAEIVACGGMMPDLRADFATLDLETQVRQVLAAWQSPLPRLLVFDNCEEPTLLAHWRPPTGGSRVLVTSRRRTWDAGLGVQLLALDTLPRAQSVELLRKFHRDLAASDPQLDQIAAELGDLPLALHLAGSFLARYRQVVSPANYLAKLQQPDVLAHRSLQAGDLSPTGHVQHVARTFALSYQQLHPDNPQDALALALLARAAWFAPGQPIPRALLTASIEPHKPQTSHRLRLSKLIAPIWNLMQARQTGDRSKATDLQTADALAKLVDLGLLELDTVGDLLVHRLIARFVQWVDAARSQQAQQHVADILLKEARRINNAGIPGPLLAWQPHLRHITDLVRGQASEAAAGLCNTLGFHLKMIGEYAAARPYVARALAIREEASGARHPDTAQSLNNLSYLLQAMGEYAVARPYLERALAITEEVLGARHPHTATSLNNLGGLLQAMGEYASAWPYYERALAIREEVLGARHPDTAQSLNNLGYLLDALGEYRAARPYYERALAIREEVLGDKHPDTAASLNNLGMLLKAQGEDEAARPYLERALVIQEEVLGDKHPDTAASLNNLGYLLDALGEYEAARPYYERALAIREEVLGDKHPDTAASLNNLGYLLRGQGEYAAARPYYERALAILEERLGPEHPSTQTVRENLAALPPARQSEISS